MLEGKVCRLIWFGHISCTFENYVYSMMVSVGFLFQTYQRTLISKQWSVREAVAEMADPEFDWEVFPCRRYSPYNPNFWTPAIVTDLYCISFNTLLPHGYVLVCEIEDNRVDCEFSYLVELKAPERLILETPMESTIKDLSVYPLSLVVVFLVLLLLRVVVYLPCRRLYRRESCTYVSLAKSFTMYILVLPKLFILPKFIKPFLDEFLILLISSRLSSRAPHFTTTASC